MRSLLGPCGSVSAEPSTTRRSDHGSRRPRIARADAGAAAYEKYPVPETGQIFYEPGFANFDLHPRTEVHFKNGDRAPLLIAGAENDHTVPASLSRKQYDKSDDGGRRLGGDCRPVDSWIGGVVSESAVGQAGAST